MNEIWLPVFVRANMKERQASFVLLTTLNMIRGMAINSLWQRDESHYKALLREWARMVKCGALVGGEIEIPGRRRVGTKGKGGR